MTAQTWLALAADEYRSALLRHDPEAAYAVVAKAVDAGATPAKALAGPLTGCWRRPAPGWVEAGCRG